MNLLRLKVVLAAIDLDDASLAALEAARALADAAGAQLHVVHAEPAQAVTEVPPDEAGGTAIDGVAKMVARAKLQPDRVQLHVIAGDPAHVIRVLADRVRADVIVLGPHREARGDRGTARQLGGTALAIATASWAPCLIITEKIRLPLERVLVPLDLSDAARGALMVALTWSSALRGGGTGAAAESAQTQLTALYVDRAEQDGKGSERAAHGFDAELDRARRAAGNWAGVAIDGVVVARPDVAAAIADRARDDRVDLIVLGTRGLGLDPVGRLGSVSAAVTRTAEVPVLLVPPAVWATYGEADRA